MLDCQNLEMIPFKLEDFSNMGVPHKSKVLSPFIVCNSENVICDLKKMLQLKKAILPLILSLRNSTELV